MQIRCEAPRRHLIQTFRAMQAVAETGATLVIPEAEAARWQYMAGWLEHRWRVGDGGAILRIDIDHEAPTVRIGQIERPLLWPREIFDLYRRAWCTRTLPVSFAGAGTLKRKQVLWAWRATHWRTRAAIKWTQNGRRWPEKAWDPEYVQTLGRTQFVLCPDGDFVWTYRFFEAAATGAIPIIQNESEHYEGFHYLRMRDSLGDWSEELAVENYERARSLLSVPVENLAVDINRML